MIDIPFHIPAQYLEGIGAGELTRTGTLIKDAASGRIVAHVQESGLAQQLLSLSPATSLANPISTANQAYNTIQLAKLQQMMETMQLLQFANIGVSLVGVGVSVVGFALVNRKLKKIEQSVARLEDKIDSHFRQQYQDKLRWVFAHIGGLFEKADIARSLANPTAEYLSINSELANQSALVRGELEYRLSLDEFDEELFNLLSRTLFMTNAARIEVLLAADEMDAAHETAQVIGRTYRNLFDDLSPYDLAVKQRHRYASQSASMAIYAKQNRQDMEGLVECVREVTDAALTKPLLIESLDRRGIRGSDFITRLRNEKETPILMLPA